MTKTILFIHSAGTQGPQQGSYDLVNWLRTNLAPSYSIIYPLMHDPETPEYASWKEQLERELALLDDEIIIIGHSLGGSVILKLLAEEKMSNKISALFLVAVPFWGGDEEWQMEEYVLDSHFAQKLPNIPIINLYHSIDDQWVPSEHMTLYRQELKNSKANFLEGNDHEFKNGLPALLKDIKKQTLA